VAFDFGAFMNVHPAVWTVVTLMLGAASAARAADDPAPLSLVDESVAICLEVPSAERTWTRLQSSQFVERLKEFPPFARLVQGGGFQKWLSVEDYVHRTTGRALSDHLRSACAESLVIAIYTVADQSPEGVVLARARSAESLAQTISAWETLEPQHQKQVKQHQGREYLRWTKSADSRDAIYYVVLGSTLALSDREHRIQQVIELSDPKSKSSARLWKASAAYQLSRSRLPQQAAAYVDLNPRQWDSVVASGVKDSPDGAWIPLVFQQVSAASAALRLDEEVVLDLVVETRNRPLSGLWKPVARATQRAGNWSSRIPATALLSISSRFNVAPLIQAWVTYAPEARTEDFARGRNLLKSLLQGHDPLTEVLPAVFSDWTISVVPSAEDAEAPVELVGQFALPESAAALSKSLDHGLLLGMSAVAATVSHRQPVTAKPVIVVSEGASVERIHALQGLPIWNPAASVSESVLRVGSSVQALSQIPSSPTSSEDRLAVNEQRYFARASQLIWFDSVQTRAVLSQRRESLARLVPSDSRERIARQLNRLEDVIRLFDSAFIAGHCEEDHLHVVLGVSLDRPVDSR